MNLAPDPYHGPESPLTRWDPRWKLAGIGLTVAMVTALQTIEVAAVAFLGALTLAVISRLRPSWVLARLVTVLPFLIVVGILLALIPTGHGATLNLGPVVMSKTGLIAACLLTFKGVAILLFMLILIATAPLNVNFHAAHSLRVPGLLVHLCLLTYRYLNLLTAELARLRIALRVRGYHNRPNLHSYRTIGQVAGTLLVRSQEQGDRVSQAMRSRGFDGRFRSLAEFRTKPGDMISFGLLASAAASLLAWDFLQR